MTGTFINYMIKSTKQITEAKYVKYWKERSYHASFILSAFILLTLFVMTFLCHTIHNKTHF